MHETEPFPRSMSSSSRPIYQSQQHHTTQDTSSEKREDGQREANFQTPSTTSQFDPNDNSPPASDESILSQALYFTGALHTAPSPSRTSPLPQPIAIPQLMDGRGQSFLRAWAPSIQAFNISGAEFLAFIDNLNVVSTANPPLQVLDLAGGIIGLVPYHWAVLAGHAIRVTAHVGIAAVSKSRTDMYMKEINERMSKPRGLKVSIASAEAMRSIFRVPSTHPVLAPVTAQTIRSTTMERMPLALAPCNAALELDVPLPAAQSTLLARVSAKQVAFQGKRIQKKAIKEREKTIEKDDKRERKDDEKARKKEQQRDKKNKQRERKREKKGWSSGSDSDSYDSDRRGSRPKKEKEVKKVKEEKSTEKLLYIVIENLQKGILANRFCRPQVFIQFSDARRWHMSSWLGNTRSCPLLRASNFYLNFQSLPHLEKKGGQMAVRLGAIRDKSVG
jgi:hypothetical protein